MSQLEVPKRTMVVGIREAKEIEIYPLSIADLKKVSDLIGKSIDTYAEEAESEGVAPLQIVDKILSMIEENATKISEFVLDEPLDMKIVSAPQLAEFASIIYEMNWEETLKNAKSLKNMLGGLQAQ